jgi:hypothetical protein
MTKRFVVDGELCIYSTDGEEVYGTETDINGNRMAKGKNWARCPYAETYKHSSYDGSHLWRCKKFNKNIGSGYWGYSNETDRLAECLNAGNVELMEVTETITKTKVVERSLRSGGGHD